MLVNETKQKSPNKAIKLHLAADLCQESFDEAVKILKSINDDPVLLLCSRSDLFAAQRSTDAIPIVWIDSLCFPDMDAWVLVGKENCVYSEGA